MNSRYYYYWMIPVLLILALSATAFAQGVGDEARKHLVRGMAAIESAKNTDELSDAVDEFKKATELDPHMAAAWYNLGSVQAKMGQFKDAIASYKQYLALVPQAEDAGRVKDEITKLEFRMEKDEKVKSLAGTWLADDGTPFKLSLDGNRMILSSPGYYVTKEDVESTYTMVGNVPVSVTVNMKYNLMLQGEKVNGSWSRASFKADKCAIPEDSGEVTGEIQDNPRMLVLKYAFTKYRASTQMSVLSDDFCKEVVEVGKKDIEKKFYGPLPKGGLGIYLDGIHAYWPGGFSAIQYGWTGHLVVYGLKDDSPAFAVGLRNKDEILAVDTVSVAGLSVVDAISKLRGEPGTEVVLSIMRNKKVDTPLTIRFKRIVIPDDQLFIN